MKNTKMETKAGKTLNWWAWKMLLLVHVQKSDMELYQDIYTNKILLWQVPKKVKYCIICYGENCDLVHFSCYFIFNYIQFG